MSPTADQRAVLATGLPGHDPRPLDGAGGLLEWAAQHRLTGLLWRAADAGGGAPPAVTEAYEHALRRSLVVESTAARAIDALTVADVDTIVWKGVATAHADYPDPGMRTFYDVDLLVRRTDFARAIDTLAAAGLHRVAPPLGPHWERHFGRAAVLADSAHVEIDLHATIAAGAFGVRFDHESLFARAEPVIIGGRTALRPTADDRLVCTAYALALSRGGNLRLVRDLAQLVLAHGVDPARAAGDDSDTRVVLATAIGLTAPWIALPDHVTAWAGARHPTRRQRRALRWAHDQRGWRTDAISELTALSWRDRLAYGAGLLRRDSGR